MRSRSPGPGEFRSVDGRARRLIRAVERDLRAHLGPELLDSGLVADLYLRLRELLAERGQEAVPLESRRDLAEQMALTLYLAVSMRQSVEPTLLVSLRESLQGALRGESEAGEAQPPRRRREV
jgi:hypothetical protein